MFFSNDRKLAFRNCLYHFQMSLLQVSSRVVCLNNFSQVVLQVFSGKVSTLPFHGHSIVNVTVRVLFMIKSLYEPGTNKP